MIIIFRDLEGAENVLDLMKQENVDVQVATRQALLQAYAENENIEKINELLEK